MGGGLSLEMYEEKIEGMWRRWWMSLWGGGGDGCGIQQISGVIRRLLTWAEVSGYGSKSQWSYQRRLILASIGFP